MKTYAVDDKGLNKHTSFENIKHIYIQMDESKLFYEVTCYASR